MEVCTIESLDRQSTYNLKKRVIKAFTVQSCIVSFVQTNIEHPKYLNTFQYMNRLNQHTAVEKGWLYNEKIINSE